ncbi:MAG: beta-lactamase family protein [Candidatus Eremiobacteraeota bacterium]|nr:beta-lactamase family protein [Candidatus Eremiobacteraeota bacterium]
MRKPISFGLVFLWLFGLGNPLAAAPQPHTFTAAMAKSLDAIARRQVRSGETTGLSVGVVEDGRIVFAHGYGLANAAAKLPTGAGTQFFIGAITRQFTAAAVLLLAQNKQLSLDDKIVKYLPDVTISPNITVLQLLQQTSGLPVLGSTGISPDSTRPIKPADILQAIDKLKPTSEPGAKFVENPLNYYLAGLIIEKVSALPLSDYLAKHIFEPLVMNETFYSGDQGISKTHALGYTGKPHHLHSAPSQDLTRTFGSNGLVSTVYDLAKWDIALPILLNVDSIRVMFTPSSPSSAAPYGMGWTIDQRAGHRYVWQNGRIPGYHAMNAELPDDHIAVIVLTNTDDFAGPTVQPEALAGQILDVVAPPSAAHVGNAIVTRAKEWLERLTRNDIDRTQLTPAFSAYLTDELVAKTNLRSLGKLITLTPIASYSENGDAVYEFLAQFAKLSYHYKMSISANGKIDGLVFLP